MACVLLVAACSSAAEPEAATTDGSTGPSVLPDGDVQGDVSSGEPSANVDPASASTSASASVPPAPPGPVPWVRPAPFASALDTSWYVVPFGPHGSAGQVATVGTLAAQGTPTDRTVLVLPGGGGASTKDLDLLRALAARGLNVVYACYFQAPYSAPSIMIQCLNAPTRSHTDPAPVNDMDQLVGAASQLFPSTQVSVVAMSISGTWALSRAAEGGGQPVAAIAPFTSVVVGRAAEIQVPVLLYHGGTDTFVPMSESVALADALASNGKPVELHVWPSGTHGMVFFPEVQADIADRISAWLATIPSTGP